MNHIIHGCSHPKWRDSAFGSELEIFQGIQEYLERLVKTCRQDVTPVQAKHSTHTSTVQLAACRPERLVMIAIDGVAPQAKMCQQRTRRFMSAHTEQMRRVIEQEVWHVTHVTPASIGWSIGKSASVRVPACHHAVCRSGVKCWLRQGTPSLYRL